MPTVCSADSFVSYVKQSGLIEQEQLKRLLTEIQEKEGDEPDSLALAGELINRKALTRWQAEKLLQGKSRGFFLGKYRLLSLLGKGGMSAVYLAEHVLMRRRCAIKVLPSRRVNDSSYLGRFHREAQAVASLDHPNIVRAYDVDSEKDERNQETHFLVMEYVEGQSLHDMVHKQGPLGFVQSAEYVRQAAEGLAHAHQAGMVHRDIKPGNLLVDLNGVVRILDLGLARFFDDNDEHSLTVAHDEKVLGTADYLAPEQALDSHKVDARADIYSLGCTFYFLLTGHPPFTEGTLAQRLMAHQTKMPPALEQKRVDAPPSLVAIINRMMAKLPEERYQTAGDLVQTLHEWLTEYGGDDWKAFPASGSAIGVTPGFGSSRVVPPSNGSGRSPADSAGPRSGSQARQSAPPDSSAIPVEATAGAEQEPSSQPAPPAVVPPSAEPPMAIPVARAVPVKPAAPKATPVRATPSAAPTAAASAAPVPVVAAEEIDVPAAEPVEDAEEFEAFNFGTPGGIVTTSAPASTAPQARTTHRKKPSRPGIPKSWLSAGIGVLLIGGVAAGFAFLGGSDQPAELVDAEIANRDDSADAAQAGESLSDPRGLIHKEITVGPAGDFSRIGDALTYVTQHFHPFSRRDIQVIKVAGGTYAERVSLDNSAGKIPAGIHLRAAGPARPVLQPGGGDPILKLSGGIARFEIDGFDLKADGKAVAIDLADSLDGVKLQNLNVSGFTDAGVRAVGATGGYVNTELLLENNTFRAGSGSAVGMRLASRQGRDTSQVIVRRCDFFGPMAAGLSFEGDSYFVQIRECIFAQGDAGIRFQGAKRWKSVLMGNNTFYQLQKGIVFTEFPSTQSDDLSFHRNLFVELKGPEAVIEKGFDWQKDYTRIFPLLSTSGAAIEHNWTTRSDAEKLAAGELDLFGSVGQGSVKPKFASTDPADSKFLAPAADSPQARVGQPRLDLKPWVGAKGL